MTGRSSAGLSGGVEASRYDPDREDLADLIAEIGETTGTAVPAYRVDQLWQGLYGDLVDPEDVTTLPKTLREALAERLPAALVEDTRSVGDGGDTVKWLWRLADGSLIETVLMYYEGRSTVCVSTQAGCAMACGFCATGQMGFDRHLSTGEIVEQVVRAQMEAGNRRVSNVVFMGMGEPLANYDRTWAAVERLHGGLGLSARHLTISTVGVVPGIRRMATERLPVNLAVSLHAADDDLRDELVPINRRYPLADLAEACAEHVAATGRRLSFEWALIHDVNDRLEDAGRLADYARPLGAHVNLIPLNPTPGWPTRGSSPARVREFANEIRFRGGNATIRQTRGTGINAACGQLRADRSDAGERSTESTTVATPKRREPSR
ncbi:MAG: 23S rRNA (adenine(2503)-C(2))-methyltransferase RlmN [Actinomycetota bacterium]|nr:23S rRNA (adenine(2503)-C(2))-methyltransferase RlmN [Actinomycetota bacterium]MEC9057774.1 23S rRNA (adenine(2503)-C(2))-methyltransferase RlmN [Actinomycetota bacterium]MED5394325.1 23S rRNA (adenine(2503)-C(2))-methyltransferase RlmN [Actinomycetota bacterium]MEE3354205.1 23S rRNA (adenine(2503)-C(2))-methyltransferase RlmN [Actinomycetota bacterium]